MTKTLDEKKKFYKEKLKVESSFRTVLWMYINYIN